VSGFQFDPLEHAYTLDGVRLPGVTEILEAVGVTDFSKVPAHYLDAAKARGTRVHRICELWDLGKLNREALTLEDMGYLLAWRRFRKARPCGWDEIEKPMFSPGHRYAGTPDRFGGGVLVDIKTGGATRAHHIQTAAYSQLIRERFGLRASAKISRVVVYLSPDGSFSSVEGSDRGDWNIFLSAKNIFNFKNGAK